MKVRRSIIVLAFVTLALPLAIFARRAARDSEEPAAASQSLSQYVVAEGTLEVTISAVGAVEADQVAQLSFSLPGRIAEVLVSAGQSIRAGDVVARQGDETQRLTLEAAQLALAAAELNRDDLLAGPSESDLAIAEANIEAAIGAYNSIAGAVDPDQVRAAELQVGAAQQALSDAQTRRVTAGGSPEQIALLDAQIGEASFNAEMARLNLETLQQGASAQAAGACSPVSCTSSDTGTCKSSVALGVVRPRRVCRARFQVNFMAFLSSVGRCFWSASGPPLQGGPLSVDSSHATRKQQCGAHAKAHPVAVHPLRPRKKHSHHGPQGAGIIRPARLQTLP
ncbi:MAG: hypothetical protein HUU31_14195 [Anaerolineae bacterium]|nr:hypothetical protein [Anaerolineae bacterium]